MNSIYELMEKDWKTYCLMAGILIIEELKKPSAHPHLSTYKGKTTEYTNYHSLRLKMKDKSIIDKWFKITKIWEKRLNKNLIGESFKKLKKQNDQYYFIFSTVWLYLVMNEIRSLPSKHTYDICIKRIKNWKRYKNYNIKKEDIIKLITKKRNLYYILSQNKKLAAGAFIVSFDLEFRGAQFGHMDLCMSEKYKDFLEFMLKIANRFGWSTKNVLSPVKIDYNKKIGINASPQYNFRIKINKLGEIYKLAGPLADPNKDKCIKFHVSRSKNFINKGGANKINNTKLKLLNTLKKLKKSTTTELQFYVNVGVDVILDHLHDLENRGLITKKRKGKRYLWRILNASQPRNTI